MFGDILHLEQKMDLLSSTTPAVLYQHNKNSTSLPFVLYFTLFMKFHVLPGGKPRLNIIIAGFRSDEQKRKAIKNRSNDLLFLWAKVFTLAYEITFLKSLPIRASNRLKLQRADIFLVHLLFLRKSKLQISHYPG